MTATAKPRQDVTRPIPMTTDEPAKPKRRRRWLQYSLRTFFVLLTVACVWLGWTVHRANEQRKVVEWVRKMGGAVSYEYQIDEVGDSIPDFEPPSPKWWSKLLGPDNLQGVLAVYLNGTRISDTTPLAGLKSLKWLEFSRTQVGDLTPLANLTNLEVLYINSTPVSDVTPLAGLKNLERLHIEGTPVSKEQVEELRKALPNCDIRWSPPDPSP